MPYLQLDVCRPYSPDAKRRLAKELGQIYAVRMQADIKRVSVAIRELTPGGWPTDQRAVLHCRAATAGDAGDPGHGRSTAYEPWGMPTKVVRSMAAA